MRGDNPISLERFEKIYNQGAAAAFDCMIEFYEKHDHYDELYAGAVVRELKKLKEAFTREDAHE